MLKRAELRRFLLCMLKSDQIPQGLDAAGDCLLGNLWEDCDGVRLGVFDHETGQLETNADGRYDLENGCVRIVIETERTSHTLSPSRIENSEYSVRLHIIAVDATGIKRQDMLDEVEQRIYYRIINSQQVVFVDRQTGENLRSFMRWIDQNTLKINTTDDSAHESAYTIRELLLTFDSKDCIGVLPCGDVPLCFDFKDLTRLDKDA